MHSHEKIYTLENSIHMLSYTLIVVSMSKCEVMSENDDNNSNDDEKKKLEECEKNRRNLEFRFNIDDLFLFGWHLSTMLVVYLLLFSSSSSLSSISMRFSFFFCYSIFRCASHSLLFRFLLSFSIQCYDPHCISIWNESEKWSDKNFHRIPPLPVNKHLEKLTAIHINAMRNRDEQTFFLLQLVHSCSKMFAVVQANQGKRKYDGTFRGQWRNREREKKCINK